MQTVLIVGAGKSSSYLIEYMLQNARNAWRVIVMDSNGEAIAEKLNGHPKGEAAIVDIFDEKTRQEYVEKADIVLSVMPPQLHILLAQDCLKFNKHLITSSYASDDIKALHEQAKAKGLLFMCEMGLDPGIDHMSASEIINSIHRIAGSILSFKSYCGGLIDPDSDDNPWNYKISWNARNIVTAGADGASWLESGKPAELSYSSMFENAKKVKIYDEQVGTIAYYPNRDSLKYLDLYDLPEIKTFMRATLRFPNFMKGWDALVKANYTNTKNEVPKSIQTYLDWTNYVLKTNSDKEAKEALKTTHSIDDKTIKLLEWLGIFDDRRIFTQLPSCSSADILQLLIEEKWKMRAIDKDMIIMQHEFLYERRGQQIKLVSTMIVKGENKIHSAMAKCVGLPMAILAKRILNEGVSNNLHGVHIPIMSEIYTPVLKELKKHGVEFIEHID